MTADLPSSDEDQSKDEFGLSDAKKSDYLLFDEAVCWVAYGQYVHPPIGPREYLSFYVGENLFEEEGFEQRGRYDLAEDQVIAAIENGLVTLAGRYEYVREIGHSPDNKGTGSVRMRMHHISAEAFAANDFYEESGNYFAAGQWYDRLIVPQVELEAAFRSFLRRSPQVEPQPPAALASNLSGNIETLLPSQKRRGRPPEWDWDALHLEIIALANSPDGLPEKQAALEDWAANYFQRTVGREPSNSSIRSKLGPIYERLRQKSR